MIAALAVLIFGYGYILEGKLHWRDYSVAAKDGIEWKTWSPEAVAKARSEGHPVLVDFTADSCLNCQVNKITSLEIPATRSRLKEINAVALIADYTDENPQIARELAKYQRSGVPMVLVYPATPDGAPIVLPTVLTPAIVAAALAHVSK
jgi:thiol:disulfide interchange protein DsbD